MRAALLLLLLCDVETESTASRAFLYLARHQNDDGSWGRPPKSCTCRVSAPLPSASTIPSGSEREARLRHLIERFHETSIDLRERAQEEILLFGSAAAPLLDERSREGDPELAGRCRNTLQRLLRQLDGGFSLREEPDQDVEATSLALLCFLGAGYWEGAREKYTDRIPGGEVYHYGAVVFNGLQWLRRRQDHAGIFAPRNPTANAMAVLAVLEAFQLSAAPDWKEPADRGLRALLGTTSTDRSFNVWKSLVLDSAFRADVAIVRADDLVEQLRLLENDSSPRGLSASLTLMRDLNQVDGARLAEFSRLLPEALTTEELNLATLAMYRTWKVPSAPWARWSEQTRALVVPTQELGRTCEYGSWPGPPCGHRARLLPALHSLLSALRYYRYANVFGQWER